MTGLRIQHQVLGGQGPRLDAPGLKGSISGLGLCQVFVQGKRFGLGLLVIVVIRVQGRNLSGIACQNMSHCLNS